MDQALLELIPEDRRLIHETLTNLAGRAYYQEPPNTGMVYPCIIYKLDDIPTDYADNVPYRRIKRYVVTVIDEDPDSGIREAVADLPKSSFSRAFTADDLNHFVFNLVF